VSSLSNFADDHRPLNSRRTLFANRNFLLLLGGRGASELGDFFGELALSWVAVSAGLVALSLNLILFYVPRSLVRLYAGVFVDRWNRRNIMIGTETIRGLLFATIGVINLVEIPPLVLIYTVSFLVGLFGALFELANEALLPLIVEKPSLLLANSAFTATFQVDNILGPALAGFAIYLLGTGVPLLVDSISFFVLVMALLLIRGSDWRTDSPRRGGWYSEFKVGLEFFRQRSELVWLAVIISVINFGLAAFWNLYILVFARDVLLAGSAGWGLLGLTSALGILLGSVLIGRRTRIQRRRLLIVLSLLSTGLGLVVFSFTRDLPSSLLAILVVGFAIPFSDIVIVTHYQEIVPREMMGRVFGVRFFLAYMLIPFSLLFGFAVTLAFGVSFAILVSGLLILGIGVITIFVRSIGRLDLARGTDARGEREGGPRVSLQTSESLSPPQSDDEHPRRER